MADGWILTCPECGHRGGDESDFQISLGDECFCPKCKCKFILDRGDDEDDEDEE